MVPLETSSNIESVISAAFVSSIIDLLRFRMTVGQFCYSGTESKVKTVLFFF